MIDTHVSKLSIEYRALATLRYLYPKKFNTLIKAEAPDFQDSANYMGIEVTASVKPDDMETTHIFYELKHDSSENQNKTEKHKNMIEKRGYSLETLNNIGDSITKVGTADGEKQALKDSIRKKVAKLKRYREKLDIIGLVVLLIEIPTSYAETHLSKWISEVRDEFSDFFDFVYVISNRFCFHYNIKEKSIEMRTLTNEEDLLLKTIGRMTAEDELSMADEEWQETAN